MHFTLVLANLICFFVKTEDRCGCGCVFVGVMGVGVHVCLPIGVDVECELVGGCADMV
jgi:hypothetical protein